MILVGLFARTENKVVQTRARNQKAEKVWSYVEMATSCKVGTCMLLVFHSSSSLGVVRKRLVNDLVKVAVVSSRIIRKDILELVHLVVLNLPCRIEIQIDKAEI